MPAKTPDSTEPTKIKQHATDIKPSDTKNAAADTKDSAETKRAADTKHAANPAAGATSAKVASAGQKSPSFPNFVSNSADENPQLFTVEVKDEKHSVQVGTCEKQGKRDNQEDALIAFVLANYKDASPAQRNLALKNTMARIQKECGQQAKCGSTACGAIAWRESNNVHIDTSNLGDSTAFVVVTNKKTQQAKIRRLNKLHNPDPNNPEAKEEVARINARFEQLKKTYAADLKSLTPDLQKTIADSIQHRKGNAIHQEGLWRYGNGISVTRALGDTTNEVFGLSHDAEITQEIIEVSVDEEVHIVVGCDGLTENNCQTPTDIALTVIINSDDPAKAAQALVTNAIAKGSADNNSAAVFKIGTTPTGAFVFDGHSGDLVSKAAAEKFTAVFSEEFEKAKNAKLEQTSIEESILQTGTSEKTVSPDQKADQTSSTTTENLKIFQPRGNVNSQEQPSASATPTKDTEQTTNKPESKYDNADQKSASLNAAPSQNILHLERSILTAVKEEKEKAASELLILIEKLDPGSPDSYWNFIHEFHLIQQILVEKTGKLQWLEQKSHSSKPPQKWFPETEADNLKKLPINEILSTFYNKLSPEDRSAVDQNPVMLLDKLYLEYGTNKPEAFSVAADDFIPMYIQSFANKTNPAAALIKSLAVLKNIILAYPKNDPSLGGMGYTFTTLEAVFTNLAEEEKRKKLAVAGSDQNQLLLLFKSGIDINTITNPIGNLTLLYDAVCKEDNLPLIQFLLKNGANPNLQYGKEDETILQKVIKEGKKEYARELINLENIDLNLLDSNRKSALDYAIEQKDYELATLLIKKGADPRPAKTYGSNSTAQQIPSSTQQEVTFTPHQLDFYRAVQNHNEIAAPALLIQLAVHDEGTRLREILSTPQVDVESLSSLLNSPALIKVHSILNEEKTNKEILNFQDRQHGNDTLLYYAASAYNDAQKSAQDGDADILAVIDAHYTQLISALLQREANPNLSGSYGNTALHLACKENNEKLAKLLIEHKANSNIKNDQKNTPLHVALANKNFGLVSLLLKNGANPDLVSYKGTALHYACEQNDQKLIELLFEHKADCNIKNNKGSTPLHLAIENKNYILAQFLISKGADITIRDNAGYNAKELLHKNYIPVDYKWASEEMKTSYKALVKTLEEAPDLTQSTRPKEQKEEKLVQGTPTLTQDELNNTVAKALPTQELIKKLLADTVINNAADPNPNPHLCWDFASWISNAIPLNSSNDLLVKAFNTILKNQPLTEQHINAILLIKQTMERGYSYNEATLTKLKQGHGYQCIAALETALQDLLLKQNYKKLFLQAEVVNPDSQDSHGRTLLHHLAIQAAKHPGSRGDFFDRTKRVIDAGANLNIKDDAGHTPLYYAAVKGNREQDLNKPALGKETNETPEIAWTIANEMIKAGANPSIDKLWDVVKPHRPGENRALTQLRSTVNKYEALNAFITETNPIEKRNSIITGKVSVKDKNDNTIKRELDLSVQDATGKTALLDCLEKGQLGLASRIIEKMTPADLNKKDYSGKSALDYAIEKKAYSLARYMIEEKRVKLSREKSLQLSKNLPQEADNDTESARQNLIAVVTPVSALRKWGVGALVVVSKVVLSLTIFGAGYLLNKYLDERHEKYRLLGKEIAAASQKPKIAPPQHNHLAPLLGGAVATPAPATRAKNVSQPAANEVKGFAKKHDEVRRSISESHMIYITSGSAPSEYPSSLKESHAGKKDALPEPSSNQGSADANPSHSSTASNESSIDYRNKLALTDKDQYTAAREKRREKDQHPSIMAGEDDDKTPGLK